jgi:serpin B
MFSRKTPLICCLLIACFTSCKKSGVLPPNPKGSTLVLTALDEQKISADNAFTFRLFKNIDSASSTDTNLFVSPLSVSFALGMTSNGALGSTLDAFKNTLNFAGLTQDQINSYYNNLITNLPKLDPNTTINIANSIWYRQGFSVEQPFLQTNSNYFHAQIQALDFTSPSAISTINDWVNSQTKGKIPTIINNIPSNAVMYLINAMYFKSAWNEKFDPSQTRAANFYLANNSFVSTDFMNATVDANWYNDASVTVAELPYSNKKYSMVIVMPSSSTGSLSTLLAGLDASQWDTWMSKLQPAKLPVSLPKFKFSYQKLLNNPLADLGLAIAFTDYANFSLINNTEALKIDKVVHKAFIETDEDGTTAAAATSVGVVTSVAFNTPQVIANHPFMFAIRERSSGLILFTGVVNNPTLTGD